MAHNIDSGNANILLYCPAEYFYHTYHIVEYHIMSDIRFYYYQ
jgi:hypothetical protein